MTTGGELKQRIDLWQRKTLFYL